MPRVFISYRRSDSSAVSGRIYDRLVNSLGERSVFKDVDDIPPGADFRKVLENEVGRADVLLVIIGRQWATVADEHGQKRLDDPNDFVRIEIETSLRREDMLTIPVLVDNAPMPDADQLPDSLQELRYRNAVPVRNDPDFNRDITRLINHLKNVSNSHKVRRAGPSRRILNLGGVFIVALLLASMATLLILWQRGAEEALAQSATKQASTVIAQNMTSAALSNRVGTLEIMTQVFAAVLSTATPATDTPRPSTATETERPSDTPLAPTLTETERPSDTLRPPTATDTPQPTATEAALTATSDQESRTGHVDIDPGANLHVRREPNALSESLHIIPTNTEVEILATSADGAWYYVHADDDISGWAAAQYIDIEYDASLSSRVILPTETASMPPTAVQATAEPAVLDRTGETLDSALLTANEATQLLALIPNIAEDAYVLRFNVVREADLDIIWPMQIDSESEFYSLIRRVNGRINALIQRGVDPDQIQLELGVREQDGLVIVYPILKLNVGYAGFIPGNLQLFSASNLSEILFGLTSLDTDGSALTFFRADSNLTDIIGSDTTPVEGELLVGKVQTLVEAQATEEAGAEILPEKVISGELRTVYIGGEEIEINPEIELSITSLPIYDVNPQ